MINPGYIICLAYLIGLLLSGLSHSWIWGASAGAIATLALPRVWRNGPSRLVLAAATVVSLVAGAYLQLRTPVPTLYNVSQWVSANAELNCITGTLEDAPQLTRRGQLKVQLNASQIEISGAEDVASPRELAQISQPLLSEPVAVDGRLYVTLPLLQGTGLYPSQPVRACGQLYTPQPAQNPSGFDFAAYLARQGIFAGLRAKTIEPIERSDPPILWQLRQRIVRAFVEPLGSPKGVLLSAMVLGRRAVDLPYDVRDAFSQVGLAHTLAASGFHVSLLLGLFLVVTQRLSAKLRLGLGSLLLLGYAGLTGLQPSICRAVLMGVAALLGNTLARKTRPVGLLLAIATLILLVNPIWIWNLGFQLSFLATLGLLVTTRPLTRRLDWLPAPIATALAVPMAAIAWTLPVQLWAFSTLSPYSLPLNVVMTPLIALISLVGMADAAIALLLPDMASAIAQGLSIPIQILMASVTLVTQLPGQTVALGQSLPQMALIYGAYGLVHQARPRQRLMLVGVVVGLLLLPGWWTQRQLVQVTVLAGREPMVVVQERGLVGVIGDAGASDLPFGLLPFVRQQGINHIDWAIHSGDRPGEQSWTPELSIRQRYSKASEGLALKHDGAGDWAIGMTQSFGSSTVLLQSLSPVVVDLALADQRWRIVSSGAAQNVANDEAVALEPSPGGILVWSGQRLQPQWHGRPEAAIATSDAISSDMAARFAAHEVPVHVAGQSGAVQWRPGRETVELIDADSEF